MGIILDGTELYKEGSPSSNYSYQIIQTKDDFLVSSNKIITDFKSGYTFIKISNWNNNLSEMKLYDIEKSVQNGKEYIYKFSELVGSECDVKIKPNYDNNISLFIIHGVPIYEMYGGTCQVEYMDGHNEWFSVFIDAITGEPLFVQNRLTF